MPELPEVETTRRGIEPHLLGQRIESVQVREPRLRWPVPGDLAGRLIGQRVVSVARRAKYLLIGLDAGTLIGHLGMSGSLRIVAAEASPQKHDHVDIGLESGAVLRFNDPRRFGSLLWCDGPVEQHPLLSSLGPEPLAEDFSGDYLYQRSRGRRQSVKTFLMANAVVVGVGNIYANEALFDAGIDPRRGAGRISLARYRVLSDCVKLVLARAIEQGGTTLKDFVGGDGKPGYFQQSLNVYGREGQPCRRCGELLLREVLGQRATVYCSQCQR
ncbi:bifunctional DNA-formamidopyrimidine glycosylase/DNA-(apurinic or apyrimidinic site) lyase [Motiliproteus sediminis]|uniref:bifunctional DNA-formamidopyrimidine glycosylase/DNA-(apurinic or apyrimidinic site) lyase n=1 Tax=Motiliproteus sediminis TaxID=1468178 RepID=UPI001AEFF5BF|nr:bifunctional DNA-formamidopyrimidine glycosylase/DNA-(apurinic or apyrimidinic site) lyase [Motiliproteus sediminis]